LGNGTISIEIKDLDRKFNINVADEIILRQALTLIGVDAASFPTIVDSILDWRDPDDDAHMSGSESSYYQSLPSPYFAKNGPFDDLSELLLVHGVTPAMYWGSAGGWQAPIANRQQRLTLSSRLVNINTASPTTLQIFPEIDENVAQAIVTARNGPDGAEGTPDDTPFRSPQELGRVPGMHPNAVAQFARFFTVRSLVFEVRVDAQIDSDKRQYVAVIRRNSPRDIQVLNMYWK